jgi:hypothetical protein
MTTAMEILPMALIGIPILAIAMIAWGFVSKKSIILIIGTLILLIMTGLLLFVWIFSSALNA